MSLQRSLTANLPGYGEVNYPRQVELLAERLVHGVPSMKSPTAIEQAARLVPGFNGSRSGVVTADGYAWLRVLEFRVADTRRSAVAVAIPHAQDSSRSDGSPLDRLPAVYLRHSAGVDDANAILGMLATGL